VIIDQVLLGGRPRVGETREEGEGERKRVRKIGGAKIKAIYFAPLPFFLAL
jgi:hypothetical protein